MEKLVTKTSKDFSFEDSRKNNRGGGDVCFKKALQHITEKSRGPTRGPHRFGSLSHHSFFSRHNPHPNRVTHIQGLNGTPVCTVNDDLWTTPSLQPHPFIKSQIPAASGQITTSYSPLLYSCEDYRTIHGSGLLSESWREELKELAAKVSLSAPAKKEKKSVAEDQAVRTAHYSAKTGRLIPPSSRAYTRHSTQGSLKQGRNRGANPSPTLYDQELLVLELLCQVLQTDSLSQVQQWLLFADQREKEFVMGLIQQAVDSSVLLELGQGVAEGPPTRNPGTGLHGSKHDGTSAEKTHGAIKEGDRPAASDIKTVF